LENFAARLLPDTINASFSYQHALTTVDHCNGTYRKKIRPFNRTDFLKIRENPSSLDIS